MSSVFNEKLEVIVEEVEKIRLFRFTSFPLISFWPGDDELPTSWINKSTKIHLKLFGFIPFGDQIIKSSIETKSEDKVEVVDDGKGDNISSWHHTISIERIDEKKTRYTDKLKLEAGILTPFIWVFALILFRYRHYRWKKLIKLNFNY